MPKSKLTPQQEKKFRRWYAETSNQFGINPNPDDPRHHYDYRGAWLTGEGPDSNGHWPSEFKSKSHPRRIIDGIDTATGEKVK